MTKRLLVIGGLVAGCLSSNAQSILRDTVYYTGNEQKWAAPCAITNVMITAYGAAGAAGSTIDPAISQGGLAGLGNKVVASWSNLTNLDTLYIYVGGKANQGQGGYNGGGNGVAIDGQNPSGGGGGATDIRFPSNALSDRIQVAGGGGGGGNASVHGLSYLANIATANGGNGGGNQLLYANSLNGSDGETYSESQERTYLGAQGGTDTAGVKANACAGYLGLDGEMGNGYIGGNGGAGNNGFGYANDYYAPSGGAGGGGYVGGNGGGGGGAGSATCSGDGFSAGGGGSAGTNYFDGVADTIENGVNANDGYVVISYSISTITASINKDFTTPCVGDSVMITATPAGGVWSTISGPNPIQSNGMFVPSQQGVYELVFTAENCSVINTDTVTVDVKCTLSLEESNHNAFNLFPNPASDYISIENAFNATISILDISGKKLITMNNYDGDKIAVSSLVQGVYLIQVAKDNIVTIKKFVKN